MRTQDLIARANAEERVFLTRNTHLADRYPRPRRAIVLKETGSVAQLNAVVKALNLDPRSRLFSRCVRCNVPLEAASDKEAVRARVVFHKFIDKCKRIYETLH